MRNLYFKIFIWFWLAMALVGAAFVISTVTTQTGERDERWQSLVATGLTLNGQRAIEVYQADGVEALVSFLDRLERRADTQAFLFDPGLVELSGRTPPAGSRELAGAAAASDELEVRPLEDGRLVARSITTPAGDEYVIVATMSPRRGRAFIGALGNRREGRAADVGEAPAAPRRRDAPRDGLPPALARGGPDRARTSPAPWYWVGLSVVDDPQALALRLVAVFLTAGVLCYGLARYLTAPVLRLRDATHRLTHGDLSVRVGPEVGKRHDELAELGRDFDLMAERIESLVTTQRQLLSDISHELRSPLARLNVALALARQRSGEEAADALDRIEGEAEQLNELIGQVLTLVRLESEPSQGASSQVDLRRLVRDIVADADFEARAKDCSARATADGPAPVPGNEQLLRSAIENVVRNAVRYTAVGTEVEVSLIRNQDRYVITVRDRGPGVAKEHLGELFKPFYRIADSRDRGTGGTGLGLAITERAVRAHGGRVMAWNAADGGLVVELSLPITRRP